MKYALITGASLGIGKEMAWYLASKGYSLVLTARNKKSLQELADAVQAKHSVKCLIIPADLSDRAAAVKVHEFCKKHKIKPEVLINNAGFGNSGFFAENDLQREMDLIQVNIASLTALTRLFVPDMIHAGKGWIQNVGSVAGFIPGPWFSSYYASKAYVLSFTEGLSEELRPHGVNVSVLCPGPTKTEFFKNAGVHNSYLDSGKLIGMMTAEEVARIGIDRMFAGDTVIITGGMNKMLPVLTRFTPRFLIRKFSAKFNQSRSE